MDTGQGIQIYSKFLRKNYQRYKKIYHVDLMCVFNKMTSDYYKKFISGKTFISGSIKNNCEKIYKKRWNYFYFFI